MLPVQQEGLSKFLVDFVFHAGHYRYEHKTGVPVNLFSRTSSIVIALQSPSSVGIGPVIFLIERFVSEGLLVYQTG